jgi:hypothetical protein
LILNIQLSAVSVMHPSRFSSHLRLRSVFAGFVVFAACVVLPDPEGGTGPYKLGSSSPDDPSPSSGTSDSLAEDICCCCSPGLPMGAAGTYLLVSLSHYEPSPSFGTLNLLPKIPAVLDSPLFVSPSVVSLGLRLLGPFLTRIDAVVLLLPRLRLLLIGYV